MLVSPHPCPDTNLVDTTRDPVAFVFMLLWVVVLAFILYNALKSCCGPRTQNGVQGGSTPRPPPPRRPGSGWFSGSNPGTYDPPPPYSKQAPGHASGAGDAGASGWRPGFWSGAALGWLGTQYFNRQREQQPYVRASGLYDWEAERMSAPRPVRTAPHASSWFGGGTRGRVSDDDRGEGPLDLGRMRRSTGLGGSHVR